MLHSSSIEPIDFELVFDGLTIPHLVLSPGLRILAVSESMCQAVSRLREDLLGNSFHEVFPTDPLADPAATLRTWEEAFAEAGTRGRTVVMPPQRYDLPRSHGRTEARYWQTSVRPIMAPDRTLRYLVCRSEDVTAHTRVAQEGVLTRESFELLTRATHDTTWETDLRTGRVWRHESFTECFGYPCTPEHGTLDFWRSCVHPDDLPALEAELAQTLGSDAEMLNVGYRVRRADDSWADVLDRAYIVRDETGQAVRLVGAMQDVTQQRQVERELRQSAARFRILTEAQQQLVWTAAPDGDMTYYNQRWYAYTGDTNALQHRSWEQFIHPDDLPDARAGWQKALQQGTSFEAEHRWRNHQGQYRWFLVRAEAIRDEAGQITQWVGTHTDIDDQRRAQALLQEKDRQLQSIISNVPAYIITLVGPEHTVGFVNDNLNTLLGGQIRPGQRIADALPSLAEEGLLQILDNVYDTAEAFSATEVPFDVVSPETQQTEQRYFDFTYQPLLNIEHRSEAILMFAVDATERITSRQQADRLRVEIGRRDERLRIMTESLPLITYISDSNGIPEYISPQWFSYTGHDPKIPLPELWVQALHPDDIAPVMQAFAEASQKKQTFNHDFRLRWADGKYRWHLTRAVPVPDARGNIVQWYGSTTDIDEQRRVTETLRQREADFTTLADTVPQLAWMAEPDGHIFWYNQRWYDYTGTTLEEMQGWGWEKVHHPDHIAAVVEGWRQHLQAGHEWEDTFPLRSHSGSYNWFLSRAVPIRDEQGRVLRWFGTNTDVTEMRQLQQNLEKNNEQLTRSNQDLDNFVYTASHDLKQPINNMAGIFEELTRTAYFRDPDAVKLIAMFERALHQIYDTIHDLSELVRVQKHRLDTAAEPIELATLTKQVLDSIRDQTAASGAVIELDFAAVPVLEFVRPNLQSILYNLLSNAVKYAAPGRPPRVLVQTRREPDSVVLVVRDNGVGIDLNRYGDQLFQMFRRFHTHTPGSGMGLYLVNRIVQDHGGWLEVSSVVDEGTTFRVHFTDGGPDRAREPVVHLA